jgi:hypothetical protein
LRWRRHQIDDAELLKQAMKRPKQKKKQMLEALGWGKKMSSLDEMRIGVDGCM